MRLVLRVWAEASLSSGCSRVLPYQTGTEPPPDADIEASLNLQLREDYFNSMAPQICGTDFESVHTL